MHIVALYVAQLTPRASPSPPFTSSSTTAAAAVVPRKMH